ncbi:NADH dehydrogenase-like protein YjlD [Thalassoglobus neptunius]|uniref:NADH:ubiquinone reductase (non-electrogenic) n=1 Tax=Thalassoglobus neptunius TaxID=1938619 RepID=A0A5C5WM59_9PLAN|nr:NAD(P)/FAD-dependent oxidoreductase [Thalassoglobus neptunius]TWT51697.1 NADH dehydrogenase-like protein YjlD [Thalassoglobus neptunius]
MNHQSERSFPRVVVIGGGFGGVQVAKRLKRSPVQVTLLDRRNFHLFQPLLYQVATGGLATSNIATPLRYMFRKQKNCEVLLADVTGFDLQRKVVILRDGELPYDQLVVAAGATHSYFGHEEWSELAPGLKTIEDAAEIRRRIFMSFERAERESDLERRSELMTFVIVGGGPTGVELAGALAEIAHHTLRNDFHHIDPKEARIVLVEAAPHILAHMPEQLSHRAAEKVRSLGIEIRTQTKVTEILPDRVTLHSAEKTEVLKTRTVLWGAGVKANPLGKLLAEAAGLECDRAGRIPVEPNLSISGHPELFVIGDIASCAGEDGHPLPGLAPVAMQQGQFVAKRIDSIARNKKHDHVFHYRDRGSMATLGRSVAVAKIGKREYCGFFAWLMWLLVHLMQIVQFENRMLVLMQWIWNYFTFNRSARLITESPSSNDSHPGEPNTTPESTASPSDS